MTKDFHKIADNIETRLRDGALEVEHDDVSKGRGKRRKRRTNFYGFVNDQSKVQRYRDKRKRSSKRKPKRAKRVQPLMEDDEETPRIVRSTTSSQRSNVLHDTDDDDDSFIDDDVPIDPNSGIDSILPIKKGGTIFSLVNELKYDSDDSSNDLQDTRQVLEEAYTESQQKKRKKQYDELLSLQADEFFDDDLSDNECNKEVTTIVRGNNNVVNVTNNHYTILQPAFHGGYHQQSPVYGGYQQQSIYGGYQQQSVYGGYDQVPAFLVGHAPSAGYNRSLIRQPHTSSFPLVPTTPTVANNLISTPVRTRPMEMRIRGMIETCRVNNSVDNEWLKKYESILLKKLHGFVTGHCLKETDIDWIKNERRNRSGRMNGFQLDLLQRLLELRLN